MLNDSSCKGKYGDTCCTNANIGIAVSKYLTFDHATTESRKVFYTFQKNFIMVGCKKKCQHIV